MKTIEQLREEASTFAIRTAAKLHAQLEAPLPPDQPRTFIARRLAIETALEKAFLAGWQAGRDGTR